MKFWITAVVGVLVVTGVMTAAWVANPDSAARPPKPKEVVVVKKEERPERAPALAFDKQLKDIGVQPQNKQDATDFVITNTGKSPLTLAETGNYSCQCSKDKSGLSRGIVPPGESATFSLAWDTKERTTNFAVWGELKTNDPVQPLIRFQAAMQVTAELLLAPEGLDFGTVNAGQTREESTMLFTRLHDAFEVQGVEVSNSAIQVDHRPMTEEEKAAVGAKAGYRLAAKLVEALPVGPFFESIALKTDLEGARSRTVRVAGIMRGEITVQPDRISFVNADASRRPTAKVNVFATGLPDEVALSLGEHTPPWLDVQVQRDERFPKLYRVTAEVPPDAPTGKLNGGIALKDQDGKVHVNIAVGGLILAPEEF